MQPGTAAEPVNWVAVVAAGVAFWGVFVLGRAALDRLLPSRGPHDAPSNPVLPGALGRGVAGSIVSLLVCLLFATALAHVQRYYGIRTLVGAAALGVLFIVVPATALAARAWRAGSNRNGIARPGLLVTAAVLCSVVLYVLQS